MSSNSKNSKLAIISAHNTARSLKFSEKPSPVKIKHNAANHRFSKPRDLQEVQLSSADEPPQQLEEDDTISSIAGVHSPRSLESSYPLISTNLTEVPSMPSTRNTSASSTKYHGYQQSSSPSPSTQYLNHSLNSHLEAHMITLRVAPTPIAAVHEEVIPCDNDILSPHEIISTVPNPIYSRSISENAILIDKDKPPLPNQSASDPAVHSESSGNNISLQYWSSRPSTSDHKASSLTTPPPLVLQSSLPVLKTGSIRHDEPHTNDHSNSTSTATATTTSMQQQDEDRSTSVAEFLALSDGPVSLEDLNIGGKRVNLKEKKTTNDRGGSSSRQGGERPMHLTNAKSPTFSTLPHSIHQFCVHSSLTLLPLQLQILSQKVHAHPSDRDWPEIAHQPHSKKETTTGTETTEKAIMEKEEQNLEVLGVTLPIETDPMKLLWVPAPGKLALYPSTVQKLLTTNRDIISDTAAPDHDEILENNLPPITIDIKEDKHLKQVKELQHRQLLMESSKDIDHQESESSSHSDDAISIESESEMNSEQQTKHSSVDSYTQYVFIMNEIAWQREQLVLYHKSEAVTKETIHNHEDRETTDEETCTTVSESVVSQLDSSSTFNSTRLMRKSIRAPVKRGTATGRPPHRPVKRTKSALARSLYLRQEVSKPPNILTRSVSYSSVLLCNQQNDSEKVVYDYNPSRIKLRRTNSVPSVNAFNNLIMMKGNQHVDDPWRFAESLWDEWFYEVLAEVRAAIKEMEKGGQPYYKWQVTNTTTHSDTAGRESLSREDIQSNEVKSPQLSEQQLELADIQPLNGIDHQACVERVKELTEEFDLVKDPHVKAELMHERSVLNRKIGKLRIAMDDLTESLSLFPNLSSPHWDKHLLLLIQGKYKLALEELTFLLKKDSNHVLGYLSKGALLVKSDRLADAIHNYTRAIWLENNNPKLYFIRAELREQKGEIEAAVSDYSTVVSLDSTNEEALMRQANHKFNRKLWGNTVQLLTNLLTINRNKMDAWLLRSQAYLNMDKYEPALKDLSAAIHLNPNNRKLYYQRGCLIRSQDPHRALKDLSLALLLGDPDSFAALIHLHRGVVYTQLKNTNGALSDFKMAIKLDPSLASAHTNAGLILLNRMKQPNEAVKYFTAAMLADPTYIRGLLCRAEAYTKMKKYKKAIVDWTRAIHYSPDNPTYYLNQGKVFLLMKDYSNAFACIKTCSKLEGGVGSSPAQQALVFAFIGDHDKAVSRLQGVLSKRHRNASLYMVLGKVQLRAKMFEDATTSFTNAIDNIMFGDPYLSQQANKATVTELHYMCGRSLFGTGNFKRAAAEFSHVIVNSPNNSWAHYYHGLALLKSNLSRGMISINHALMLNPTLTEAFLTRAAYYGKVGRLSKAILNCTEAIKLQPKSSRAYLYRGVLRHLMGYKELALADLSEAIKLSPTLSSVALFNRAICYQSVGEREKAIRDYSTILMEDQSHISVYQVLINRGLLYLEINDHANALCDFTKASDIHSNDASLWQTIAFCYQKLGKLSKAIQCYSRAIEFNPSFIEAYIGRANTYTEFLTEDGNKKARVDYEHVIKTDSTCLAARLNLALLQQCEGKHMLAWQSVSDLLEHHKDYVPGLEARAIISLQNMNTFGSLLDINRAIQLEPSPQLYIERGVIYQYMKDIYNAVKNFEKAIAMDPHLPLAHYNLGNVLLQQKLYRQAIDRYSNVVATAAESYEENAAINNSVDEALINRGICHVAVGQYIEALADFDNAIEVNPFAAHAYFNRGNLLKRNGNILGAEEDYRKALALYPNDPVSLSYHGYTLGLLGNTEESRQQFLKAVEI